jgi:hypothetical protein
MYNSMLDAIIEIESGGDALAEDGNGAVGIL